MTKATVTVAMSNVDLILGDHVTATFEGREARNEAIGYIQAMLTCGFWIHRHTVYVLTVDGVIVDFVLDAN